MDGQQNQDLVQAVQSIAAAIGTKPDDKYLPPTFTNGWTDFGGSHRGAGYMKDASGFVHVCGLIKSGTMGLPCFTLPVGYRPGATISVAATANNLFALLEVAANGQVIPQVGSNAYFSLNTLIFKAEQ